MPVLNYVTKIATFKIAIKMAFEDFNIFSYLKSFRLILRKFLFCTMGLKEKNVRIKVPIKIIPHI